MNSEIKLSSNRSFGIVFFVVFVIISFFPILKSGEIKIWSLALALIFLILGLSNSKILNPLNKIWFEFGLFLGKIISPIIMLMIFFFVVTPIGLIMRLFKKDLLSLKYHNKHSYWMNSNVA